MRSIALNTSYKHHSILGLAIGIWLVVFLIFIAPFDVADLDLKARIELLPPYALLVFIGYMLSVVLQNNLYKIKGYWNIIFEMVAILVSYIFRAILCFPYYKSDWVNGEFSFWGFIGIIYLPIALVISVVLIFGRVYLNKLQAKKDSGTILLRGTGKTDILRVNPNDILCISGAQNYVEVHYTLNGVVKKQLLRTTLKTIRQDIPELTQVHRSHLINSDHITKWKDRNTIVVNDLEIPVSKKFKPYLKDSFNSSLAG
ncbi:MAG: LytTR family DNA-binding domain-containing protein [Flavobacteriaceae bacterium]|nr:LytTR family DNA-binding domain-containing protein [Flavobacteriaceae bacterium]